MRKRDKYYDQAMSLYTELIMSFENIANRMPVTERTLRKWAADGKWQEQRKDNREAFTQINADNKKIARLLAKKIISLLAAGEEPSATLLNAFSRATSIALKVKELDFEPVDIDDKGDKKTVEQILKEALAR